MPKLPDASMLLNSASFSSVTAGTDHASQVAAAMATRKKRDSNNLEATTSMSQQHPRSKVAKGGTLPHTKNVFDTAGGILVPPQLRGRSVKLSFAMYIDLRYCGDWYDCVIVQC